MKVRRPLRKVAIKPSFNYATVERLWPGETFVCVASGPSLTQSDVDFVREKARVIAINTSIQRAPWADVLYACDARWWKWHKGMPSFPRLKFALTKESAKWPGVRVLKNTGCAGLELRPHGLRTGRNGGYQAINLAVLLGARRILLLGYDMQRTNDKEHWHGDHPQGIRSPYRQFRESFPTMLEQLKTLGIEVINCSRQTALDCFPKMSLEQALPNADQAVA